MNEAQHKIINLLETLFFPPDFLLVFVYLMCGLRQLFFFQCGPEMPKGCTLQLELPWGETEAGLQVRMYSHLALLTKEVSFWLFCITLSTPGTAVGFCFLFMYFSVSKFCI